MSISLNERVEGMGHSRGGGEGGGREGGGGGGGAC